jgi:hypothetical protein
LKFDSFCCCALVLPSFLMYFCAVGEVELMSRLLDDHTGNPKLYWCKLKVVKTMTPTTNAILLQTTKLSDN